MYHTFCIKLLIAIVFLNLQSKCVQKLYTSCKIFVYKMYIQDLRVHMEMLPRISENGITKNGL